MWQSGCGARLLPGNWPSMKVASAGQGGPQEIGGWIYSSILRRAIGHPSEGVVVVE